MNHKYSTNYNNLLDMVRCLRTTLQNVHVQSLG